MRPGFNQIKKCRHCHGYLSSPSKLTDLLALVESGSSEIQILTGTVDHCCHQQ